MTGSLKLLVAAVAMVSAPLPVFAQAWPATVVASAPQMAPQKRAPAISFDRQTPVRLSDTAARAQHAAPKPALRLTSEPAADDIPDVDVLAREEWSDDQGFRVGGTKLAFKRRF